MALPNLWYPLLPPGEGRFLRAGNFVCFVHCSISSSWHRVRHIVGAGWLGCDSAWTSQAGAHRTRHLASRSWAPNPFHWSFPPLRHLLGKTVVQARVWGRVSFHSGCPTPEVGRTSQPQEGTEIVLHHKHVSPGHTLGGSWGRGSDRKGQSPLTSRAPLLCWDKTCAPPAQSQGPEYDRILLKAWRPGISCYLIP